MRNVNNADLFRLAVSERSAAFQGEDSGFAATLHWARRGAAASCGLSTSSTSVGIVGLGSLTWT